MGAKTSYRHKFLRQNVGEKLWRHQNICVPKRIGVKTSRSENVGAEMSAAKCHKTYILLCENESKLTITAYVFTSRLSRIIEA